MTARVVFAATGICLALTLQPEAQVAAPLPMTMTGMWELGYDGRSVPRALLTPQAQTDAKEQMRRDVHAIRWCHLVGLPLQMDYGGPISIVQGRLEIAISADGVPSHARHIYLNAEHPDMDVFDPQVIGHSIGRWEGETLVVDTAGFSERGVTSLPGGGMRTERSHLVERYRLLDGGRRLSVTFTWDDRTVFLKPHTYEFVYTRAPLGTSARTLRCDASDKNRATFLLKSLEP